MCVICIPAHAHTRDSSCGVFVSRESARRAVHPGPGGEVKLCPRGEVNPCLGGHRLATHVHPDPRIHLTMTRASAADVPAHS